MIILISPEDKCEISLLSSIQKEFINKSLALTPDEARSVHGKPYPWLGEELDNDPSSDMPASVIIKWKNTEPLQKTKFYLSIDPDFTVTEHIATVSPIHYSACEDLFFVILNNLLSGYTYYFKVSAGNEESEIRSFSTVYGEIRTIRADGVGNIRDMGGRVNKDGIRIRQGLVYRGGMLNNLIKPKCSASNGLGVLRDDLLIKTDIDLRWEAIGKYEFCQLGDHINYNLFPISDYASLVTGDSGVYGDLVPNDQSAYFTKIFDILADENSYPIYIHCVAGADRTGCVCALLDAILGMKDEDIILNYNLTSLDSVRCWYTNAVELINKLDEAFPGLTLREQLLKAAEGLGITEETMDRIRGNLLET